MLGAFPGKRKEDEEGEEEEEEAYEKAGED